MSTGEVRRFLGDCLGPSDFRKNAAHLAAQLHCCAPALIELLELRLPADLSSDDGATCLAALAGDPVSPPDSLRDRLAAVATLAPAARERLAARVRLFAREVALPGRAFTYADCSVGNLVFAGCFLHTGRQFNAAITDYTELLQLPADLLHNVTDGTNAFLVALDIHGHILASEADIVDATRHNQIDDLYLIDRALSRDDAERLSTAGRDAVLGFLAARARQPGPNVRLLDKIRAADLIVYSPGTQHSSLFPSYLTPGIGDAIATNLRAVKLLLTNLREDADIAGANAVSLVDRAVYYLREKNRRDAPTPCLITHYLINDPTSATDAQPYVPLGSVDSFEDPRLVRIGNYEDGVSGRHDAARVLQPFIESLLRGSDKQRIAILLLETTSLNKIGQTLIEMIRAGVADIPCTIEVFYQSAQTFDRRFVDALPFRTRNLAREGHTWFDIVQNEPFDYVVLFESTGMYQGADIVYLLQHLRAGRVDAIWGSRRLSINDIRMAYRLLHHKTPIRGAISYVGSHLLSLTCLALYGRYISDTLSGARAIRTAYLRENRLDPTQPGANFRVLSALLRDRAELFEAPVHYFPISPEKVRQTSTGEGLGAIVTLIAHRFRPLRYRSRTRTIVPRPVFGTIATPPAREQPDPESSSTLSLPRRGQG
jgi:hypothetical protein